MSKRTEPYLPTDVVFHPNWWNKQFGISFDRGFFYNPERRIAEEQLMRRSLYERFGDIGLGDRNPPRRPLIGPIAIGTGYFIQETLGCEIHFQEDASPWVISPHLTEEEVWKLTPPKNIEKTASMAGIRKIVEAFRKEFDYLEGDVPMHSVVNVALDLRGQEYFIDLLERPNLVDHLHRVIAETIYEVGRRIRELTKTISISICRITAGFQPDILTIPNCNNQMISPNLYRKYLKKYDIWLGEKLGPMGIHHCGNNAHFFAKDYAETGAIYMDVGCGSEIKPCREAFKDRWLSLRLDPVKLQRSTAEEAVRATEALLEEHGKPFDKTALQCVNIDDGTPDETIRAFFNTVAKFRGKATYPTLELYKRF